MMWKNYRICFYIHFIFIIGINAQKDYPGLKEFLQSEIVKDAQLSIYAEEIATRDTLAAYFEHSALIPASNVKLFTSALAWSALGPKYTLKTHVYWDGYIMPEGILEGNLLVEGEGDPTSGSDKWPGRDIYHSFAQLVIQLKAKGIDTIHGDIIISSFNGEWHNGDWPWSDIGNYYGISAGAVNFNENLYNLTFNTSKSVGVRADISRILPKVDLQIENQVEIGPPHSGDRAYIYGDAHDNNRVIRGTVPKDGAFYTIKGSLPDPEAYFGWELYHYLLEKGISVKGKVRVERSYSPEKKELLLTLSSPPISEIIEYTNKSSNNLFAEAIYKAVNIRHPDKEKSQLDIWKQSGIDLESIRWKDGCGLSPFNRFSSKDFVNLLQFMSSDERYINTLALPGEDGTLRYRFLNCRNRLNAKTGSIEGVYALSGILDTGHRKIIFSILVNNFYGPRSILDREVQKLFEAW